MKMENETILIFGGSGSLGKTLIKRYIEKNKIINFSRDENKHWEMELVFKSKNLSNVIGDVFDKHKVIQTISRCNPTRIIIASALKHIDRCEYDATACINTNILGVKNVLDAVEKLKPTELKSVCFISTDKACSPINIYGMSKALCEQMMAEKSLHVEGIKFVSVRYGNVLNSRGSIIPILEQKGNDPECKEFLLTDERMTRFVMTLDESVDLIEYATLQAENGEIVIPQLLAMRLKDLMEIYSEKYGKPVRVIGLRVGEKIHEALINETQAMRTEKKGKYYHIKPTHKVKELKDMFQYDSSQNVLSKKELKEVLEKNFTFI